MAVFASRALEFCFKGNLALSRSIGKTVLEGAADLLLINMVNILEFKEALLNRHLNEVIVNLIK